MLDVVNSLALLADREGMTVRQVCRFDDLLAKVGIEKSDLSDDIIAAAVQCHRDGVDNTLRRARKINQGRADDGRQSDTTKPTTDDQPAEVVDKPKRKMGKVVRGKIFDFSATAVLRAMGQMGFDFESAGVVLAYYGLGQMSDTTIKIQLKAGKDNDPSRGPAADLTPAQRKFLVEISN